MAPRIRKELLEAIVRHDKRTHPIAETCPRVGPDAERPRLSGTGLQGSRAPLPAGRPRRRATRLDETELSAYSRARPPVPSPPPRPSTTSVLVDVALRVRPPEAVLDHISGVGVPEL